MEIEGYLQFECVTEFLNRYCQVTPKKSAKSQLVENSSNLIRLAYWRKRIISANTIGFGEGEALQKIRNALPIRQDIAY
jgi:hypothetical protein